MNLLEEIKEAKRIGIAGHVRPDGDCVGSCLALYKYLQNARPDASIKVYLEPVTAVFSFLYGYEDLDSTFAADEPFDVFIALDAGDSERLGDARELFLAAGKRLCFDHHLSNTGYADKNEIKPEASSTCEVLFTHFEKEYIDQDVAKALYTGIVHDTGVFQYSNTSGYTMEVAGKLMDMGVDFNHIIDKTFFEKTYAQRRILGQVMESAGLHLDGRVISGVVTLADKKNYAIGSGDTEGIVSELRSTRGVETAIFLYQLGSGEFKISLRSQDIVDVSAICAEFGGGGHVRAAGCNMKGTAEEIIDTLVNRISIQLEGSL